jgi:hypothetical protein
MKGLQTVYEKHKLLRCIQFFILIIEVSRNWKSLAYFLCTWGALCFEWYFNYLLKKKFGKSSQKTVLFEGLRLRLPWLPGPSNLDLPLSWNYSDVILQKWHFYAFLGGKLIGY